MVKTRLRRTQVTVRTPRQGEVRKSMDKFKRLLRTMVKKARGETAMTRRGNTEASKIRNALPLSVRDDKILAMRIAYAVRNVNRYGEVTLELDTARALLARVSPPVELEESEDPDTDAEQKRRLLELSYLYRAQAAASGTEQRKLRILSAAIPSGAQ